MQLFVAAYGWQDKAWGAFYPADLPEEWRLDYYANLYPTIVVPAAEWRGQEDATLRSWLEDAPAGFLLFWEVESDAAAQRILELYRSAEVSVPGGWLLLPDVDVADVSQQRLAALAPLMACQALGECVGKSVRLLPIAEENDLRQLRQQIDALKADGVETLVLLVKPGAGAEQALAQLHTLCQLYGG